MLLKSGLNHVNFFSNIKHVKWLAELAWPGRSNRSHSVGFHSARSTETTHPPNWSQGAERRFFTFLYISLHFFRFLYISLHFFVFLKTESRDLGDQTRSPSPFYMTLMFVWYSLDTYGQIGVTFKFYPRAGNHCWMLNVSGERAWSKLVETGVTRA